MFGRAKNDRVPKTSENDRVQIGQNLEFSKNKFVGRLRHAGASGLRKNLGPSPKLIFWSGHIWSCEKMTESRKPPKISKSKLAGIWNFRKITL